MFYYKRLDDGSYDIKVTKDILDEYNLFVSYREISDEEVLKEARILLDYIDKVQELKIDLCKEKKKLESFIDNFSSKSLEISKISEFDFNNYKGFCLGRILEYLKLLEKKYDFCVGFKHNFDVMKDSLEIKQGVKLLNAIVDQIIEFSNQFKKRDDFSNEELVYFIDYVYHVGTIYMMYELFFNQSKLFDYYRSNPHDFWYVNEIVKNEIEELKTSINYNVWLEKINYVILRDDIEGNNDYFNVTLLKSVFCALYPDKIKRHMNDILESIYNELINDPFMEKEKVLKLKKKFDNVRYGEFILDDKTMIYDLERMFKGRIKSADIGYSDIFLRMLRL